MKTIRHSQRADPQGDRAAKDRAAIAARKALAKRGEVVPRICRPANTSDLAFVLDTWATSYRFSHATGPIPRDVYDVEHDARMRRLILRSAVVIACPPDDTKRILGWIIYELPKTAAMFPIVHYVSVRPNLQDQGIGTYLIKHVRELSNRPFDPIFTTHFTLPMRKLIDKWNVVYNPYLLEVIS